MRPRAAGAANRLPALIQNFLLTIYRKGMRLIFLNQDKDIVRQRK